MRSVHSAGRRYQFLLVLAVVNADAEVTTIDGFAVNVLCSIAARSTMGTVRRDKLAAGLTAEGRT
jgi:hypothetical protein